MLLTGRVEVIRHILKQLPLNKLQQKTEIPSMMKMEDRISSDHNPEPKQQMSRIQVVPLSPAILQDIDP